MTEQQGTFWASTPTQVTAGQQFTISVNSPTQAGETITVGVYLDDGTPGTPPSVSITLDVDGKGSATYTMPTNTSFLTLTAENQSDHTVTAK